MSDVGFRDQGLVPTSHRGLTYPFGDRVPDPATPTEVAPGVTWVRLPMPWALDHINVWLLGEAEDLALVDTGPDLPPVREAWQALFAGALADRRLARVIVTHMHPDHVGLAGWLCERDGATLAMTRGEWLTARMLRAHASDTPPAEAEAWWRMAGYDDAQIAEARGTGWALFAKGTSPIPGAFTRLSDGDVLNAGGRDWRIVVGSGHSPEHACLWDEAGGVLIAGDQVLPRISPNVSVGVHEPDGDPLGDWLASIDRLLALPADLLVLPAHGKPFTGLHRRLKALRDGHLGRLDAMAAALDRPKTALEVFAPLFGRAIRSGERSMAAGEALAHLHRLERDGRARRLVEDGVARFVAASA
ncbi:MBL fold metallo-hydrolase [Sphingomonas jatrophae]|uniref:Glyoxylase, beta-lactamase superfamily II n=1 Tax=Sphingomonas jatrophae TaxID=1166337 RepID=A0A1I6K0X9_9SPHN|nr:MBL fold metallo-hydrolase [Sphingomonas jatrophae]SFR84837.1 Glyoxylase, beta-lactamase superfamily II [Sphingomonas jatrophae]